MYPGTGRRVVREHSRHLPPHPAVHSFEVGKLVIKRNPEGRSLSAPRPTSALYLYERQPGLINK